MRRLIWIVPSVIAVALSGYLLGWPTTAPADPSHPDPAASADTARLASPPAAPSSPELPVTQIVLYSSGVGFFQREGYVQGNTRVDLSFPVQDVNDLLKSMVLQDLNGGQVGAVAYDSHNPLDKTLDSFAVHLTNNPSQADILNQARGEKVEIALGRKHADESSESNQNHPALSVLQGTVMGVELKPSAGKDSPAVEVLNLWCADGMRSVPLVNIQRVKFLNATLESEVGRALEVLARGHDTQKKAVSLQFNGAGSRAVRVGYVVETPLWRTSYRLVIGKEGKLFMQGWALVDNPTNDDWKNVRMSLVSGRPISFKMDLYQPLYVPRPVVQPELYGSVRPTTHDGALAVHIGGWVAGSTTANTTGIPVTINMPQQVGPPLPTSTAGFPFNNSGALNDNDIGAILNNAKLMELRSVNAAATAKDLGDSFEYAIDQAVTIPRQKSALLPIINGDLEGIKVSLYSPSSHPKHPLLALRMKNTTGLHLMQGPVAVFEGAGYCGDAQLPDLQPGEERLVSYALDLGTEVEAFPTRTADELLSLRVHKGVLSTNAKAQELVTYTLKNRSQHDRVVLVEHPYRPGYRLVSKEQPKERARDVYRFEVTVAAGETAKLEVAEERDVAWQNELLRINVDAVRHFLQFEFSNAKAKTALEKLLERCEQLTAAQQELVALAKQLADIGGDQQRLRANLKEMPETAAAYKRYLEKFDSQETVIENLQTRIQTLHDQAQKGQHDLEIYVNGLDLEATLRKSPPGK